LVDSPRHGENQKARTRGIEKIPDGEALDGNIAREGVMFKKK
jgi:hypothetical protein